ncbi:MAG: YbbR-like domain-containing protein [Marinilabiliaceae bacterium]
MDWIRKYIKVPFIFIGKWFNRLRQNRDLIVFLGFLVIATGFWFLNALRKEYNATLSYPVRFVNLPDNRMLSDDVQDYLNLKVKAVGFVILRYQVSNTFLPLTLDVSEMNTATIDGTEGAYAVTNENENRIVGQLSQGMELMDIEPDTLFVPLVEHRTKRVAVKAQTRLSFAKQHMQAGAVILDPDSAEISGPRQIVDTMSYVRTRPLVYEELTDSVSSVTSLVLPSRVEASVKRVSATIPVEPFTELNMRIPVRVTGLPDTLRIKTFPSEVQLSFHVGMSKFENVDESDFRAEIDATPVLAENRPERLKVRLAKVPDEVESVSFSPIFVEYLLEKRR